MQDEPIQPRYLLLITILILLIPSTVAVSGTGLHDRSAPDSFEETGYIRMTEVIEIGNNLPFFEEGLYGIEVRIDGLEMDPRSSHLRLPIIQERIDLPLGSRIVDITISDPEYIYMKVPMGMGINPHSIAKIEGAQPVVPENGFIAVTDHITYDLMTGIDHETLRSEAVLSMLISPVIMEDGNLRCLVKGSMIIDHEIPLENIWAASEIFDVLLICPDSFTDVASEYSDFRNATGRFTKVVTMTDILSDTYWNINENDTQEEIKRFIYNARLLWGVDFVLLAGDQEHIPTRHIYVPDGYDDSGTQFTDGSYVPSDLYYGDLFEDGTITFTTWNEDRVGDSVHLWGEWDGTPADDPDLYPDVYVGRLPASTVTEFSNMVNKIKGYELEAKDSNWLYNATLCGTNTFTYNPTPEGEYTCDYIESHYLDDYNVTKLYETTGTLSNISETIDKGTGLLVFSDHGGYNGWGYTSLFPSGAYRSMGARVQENGYMLPIAILDACLTHGFDNENASDPVAGRDPVLNQWYYPPGSGLSERDCLGEYFHKSIGGAIATFGCTRVGYGSPGTSYPHVNSGYMNNHLNKAITEGVKTPGQVLATAQSDYLTNLGVSGGASYKTVTEYVLLGDPSLNIGGITGTNVEIDMGENVTVPPGEETTINFTVKNIGVIPADIFLNATINGNGKHIWSVNLSVENATIQAGENLTWTMDIYAPPTALATQVRELVLKVDSVLLVEERTASITAFTMRTEGVDMSMDPEELKAPQGSDAVGFINVENLGNGDEIFNISFPNLMEGWQVNMTSFSVEVDAFKTAGFPFKLTVPERYLAGKYGITVEASSTITGATTSTILNMTVEPDRSFLLEVPFSIIEIYPEYNLSIPFQLIGSTNLEINVAMDWEGSRMEDWNIGFANNFVELDPFTDGAGSIWVEAPNGTDPGVYTLELKADNGEISREALIDVVVLKKYAYIAECECPKMEISPGDDLSFTINVTNLGNIHDQFNVTVLNVPDGNWTATMNPNLFSVGKDRFKNIYLDIITVYPLNGTYSMRVLIEPWSYAGPQTIDLEVIVRKDFDFELSGGFIEDRVLPGETFIGDFDLINRGNSPDTFTFHASVEMGWSIQYPPQPLFINATRSSDLDLRIAVPEDTLAGEYTFQILITNRGSNETMAFTRTIFVKEVYDLRMQIDLEGDFIDLRPGRIFQFRVYIENNGNAPDNVNIGVAASSYVRGWISLSTSTFTAIAPGENRTLEVILTVPKNITEGDYRMSLMVGSMGEIEAVRKNLTIHVEEKGGNGLLSKVDMIPVIIAIVAGSGIVIIVGFILVRAYKKSSGVDIEDAGMEWEEDDDEEDEDWEEDWE